MYIQIYIDIYIYVHIYIYIYIYIDKKTHQKQNAETSFYPSENFELLLLGCQYGHMVTQLQEEIQTKVTRCVKMFSLLTIKLQGKLKIFRKL